ncbi:hypothetical protein DL96DRAFT_1611018 [Flagelloscypha sp. PMI_526]|nr:hypothetical protein DL96DRAFT_1611018 [Flagelloscypha sp. PMI_526]
MDFFFLPFIFGCKDTISPEGEQQPRFCPRCNNASVGRAKKRQWLELCFVPVVPMSTKHVWFCSICQWRVPSNQQWEPTIANTAFYGGPSPGYGPPPNAPFPPPQGWHGAPNPGMPMSPGYQGQWQQHAPGPVPPQQAYYHQ